MKILITAPFNKECRDELQETFGEVVYLPWKEKGTPNNEQELLKVILENDVDGLITELDDVSEYVINQAEKLKFIGVCRANPVNVDIAAATTRGIPVFCTPARNGQAVTELFIGSLISFYRQIISSNNWIHERKWNDDNERPYLTFKGNEVAGKTIGFVGFGAVGSRIANILKHFPCRIQFYDPFVEDAGPDYEKVYLEELFKTSDVVSIHLPVNDHTKGMIDEKLLKSMKEDAVFVNTARSAVVDNEALYTLLKSEKIRGAILDVFNNEPPVEEDYSLMTLPNVLATPHIAGASYEVEDHHSYIMNANLNKFLKEKQFQNVFNQKQLLKLKQ